MVATRQYKDFDDYLTEFPKDVQKKLKEIRKAIKSVAPKADESIRYMMPAFRSKKKDGKFTPLAYFAAFKNHIGFYPTPAPLEAFAKELSGYKTSKGGVQFPIDKPMPLDLIKRIVKNRLEQNDNSGYLRKEK